MQKLKFIPTPLREVVEREPAGVDGHADDRIHAHAIERLDLCAGRDPAAGDHLTAGGVAGPPARRPCRCPASDPPRPRACRGTRRRTVRALAPLRRGVSGSVVRQPWMVDPAATAVHGGDDAPGADGVRERSAIPDVHLSVTEERRADDDVGGAVSSTGRARVDRADAAAHAAGTRRAHLAPRARRCRPCPSPRRGRSAAHAETCEPIDPLRQVVVFNRQSFALHELNDLAVS